MSGRVGRRMRLRVLQVFLVLAFAGASLRAQDAPLGGNRYRPGLDFRTLTVGRVDIHYHQGLEALAQRLAGIVRAEAPALERRFGAPSAGVDIVLVDQTDVSNGWATVVPYNLIEIAAVPPPGRSPARSASSCVSRPNFTYDALVPSTRKRGPSWDARTLIQRCDRTPPRCVIATNTSSSTLTSGRRRSSSQ